MRNCSYFSGCSDIKLLKDKNLNLQGVIIVVKDKLHRRNMQIKKLKAQIFSLTDHLITHESYHPEYVEDIKNNMV